MVCRHYQEGVDFFGKPLDPSTWGAGGTAETDPFYWYSGDPVAGTGWLDNVPSDKRFMVNTGPFTFAAGDTQDIVMAYIVAQAPEGEAAVSSVNALRVVDISAQFAFDNNFDFAGPPLAIIPHYNVIAGTDTTAAKIDVYFDITDAIKHDVNDGVSQQVFQGFEVWQYRTFNDGDVFGGQVNRTLVGRFDVADEITRVFANDGGERVLLYSGLNNIDKAAMLASDQAYVKFEMDQDYLNNGEELIAYKDYIIGYRPFSVDELGMYPNDISGTSGDFVVNSIGQVLYRPMQFITVRVGSFENYQDVVSDSPLEHIQGTSDPSLITFDYVNLEEITDDTYQV
jgi:hypothetical protein